MTPTRPSTCPSLPSLGPLCGPSPCPPGICTMLPPPRTGYYCMQQPKPQRRQRTSLTIRPPAHTRAREPPVIARWIPS